MGLYMADNGYYYIKCDFDGKRIKFSTRTRDPELAGAVFQEFLKKMVDYRVDAQLSRKANLIEVSSQVPSLPAIQQPDNPASISFIQDYEEYIESKTLQGMTKSTINFKKYTLVKLIDLNFQYYSDFTQKNINAFVQSIQDYSGDTKRKLTAELRAFLNYAIKQEKYTDREYNRLSFPSYKAKARETVISEADFTAILTHLRGKNDLDFAFYLETLYFTASRPGEIIGVKSDDIDYENGSVKIFQHKTDHNKISYIPLDFAKRLKEYAIGKMQLFDGINQGPEFYSKKFKKLKIKLNLDRNYNLYTIRHTAATDLLNKTGDIELVSKQLGHSDIEMTARHYINRQDGKRRDLIQKAFEK